MVAGKEWALIWVWVGVGVGGRWGGVEVGAYSNKYGISITHFTITERILTRWTFYDVISMVHEIVDHEKIVVDLFNRPY